MQKAQNNLESDVPGEKYLMEKLNNIHAEIRIELRTSRLRPQDQRGKAMQKW